jgi:hypothetical protein
MSQRPKTEKEYANMELEQKWIESIIVPFLHSAAGCSESRRSSKRVK